MPGIRICETCNSEYETYDKRRKYCSRICFGKSDEMKLRLIKMSNLPKKKRVFIKKKCSVKYLKCNSCGNHFTMNKGKRTYCFTCFQKRNLNTKCIICETLFKYNGNKTCSENCLSIHKSNYQRGELSHRWLGGKTSQALIIRSSREYKYWRISVFERDNYTCQECGQYGGKLNADHVKPFALFPELRTDINNGRTLCFECHKKTPSFAMKAQYQK